MLAVGAGVGGVGWGWGRCLDNFHPNQFIRFFAEAARPPYMSERMIIIWTRHYQIFYRVNEKDNNSLFSPVEFQWKVSTIITSQAHSLI